MRRISYLIFLTLFLTCFYYPTNNPSYIISQEINYQEYELNSPPIVNHVSVEFSEPNDVVGDEETFWIYDYNSGFITTDAKLLSVGNYCYIYMDLDTITDIGTSVATSRCNRLRDEFDQTIYPKGIQMAGNVDGRLGDIDGDPKVTVLLTPCEPYGGYYLFENDNPSDPHSNHREMVYVNSNRDIIDIIKTTSHEFNHLIWGNYEQDEAYFLTEGAANYALYYSGFLSNSSYLTVEPSFNVCAETITFSNHPETSILDWHFFDEELNIADYGQAYMFLLYLTEKYGQDLVLDLVDDTLDGTRSIDYVLDAAGYDITFNELFLDWITACTIDEIGFDDDLYGFIDAEFTMNDIASLIWSFPTTLYDRAIPYYGFIIYKVLSPPDEFTIHFTNPTEPYYLGQSVIVKDENGWSVSQTIQRSEGEIIPLYVSGNSIDYAYIVTSLMLSTTPTDYMFQGVSIAQDKSVLLDCTFLEGYVPPEISNVDIDRTFIYLTFLPIFIGLRVILNRKTKNNY